MKLVLISIISLFVLAACSSPEPTKVVQVSPQEFQELIQDDDVFVIDTHTPEQEHIPGTDAIIPFDKLIERMDKLPKDLDTPIAVYCRSGSMSAKASQDLINMGYKNVYDLQGGRNAYIAVYGE